MLLVAVCLLNVLQLDTLSHPNNYELLLLHIYYSLLDNLFAADLSTNGLEM